MDNNSISILDFAAQPSEVIYLEIGGNPVELHRTPTIQSIIDAVQWGLDIAVTDAPVVSEAIRAMFGDFVLIKAFTNIDVDFTGAEEEAVYEAYQAVTQLHLIDEIVLKCDTQFVNYCRSAYSATFQDIMDYRRSAVGIVNSLSANATDIENNMEDAMSIFTDAAQQQRVKEIIEAANAVKGPPRQP